MKSTFSLLVLISSLAISSPIPPHMLERNSLQVSLVFTKNNKVLTREGRLTRGSRDARECRFCLRKMPRTRESRIARIDRERIIPHLNKEQVTKLAIVR